MNQWNGTVYTTFGYLYSETFERQIHDSTIKLSPLIHIY